MTIINFAYALTPEQKQAIETLSGQSIARLVEVPTRSFDVGRPFEEQARALVESAGLTAAQWQTPPLLVNLPSLSVIAALVLAELHGRMGHFPAVLRLRPVAVAVTSYEVAEILNLEAVRLRAREER